MPKLSNPGKLFCFGMGFSAQTLANSLITKGWVVSGTSRKRELKTIKTPIYLYDGVNTSPDIYGELHRATHLLISIPPQNSGDIVLQKFGSEISNCKYLKWIGYISSTGVYGDMKGEWVDETSQLKPVTSLSRRRAEVERAWLKLNKDYSLPVMIFRCASIYGPGRNLLVSVKQGYAKRIKKPGLVFSRIHVEDLAQSLEASMHHPQPGEIYNVTDDHPSSPSEAIEYACSLLKVEPPPAIPYDSAKLTDIARGFYQANKRVSNTKMKIKLGVRLKYPDYRTGLKDLLSEC